VGFVERFHRLVSFAVKVFWRHSFAPHRYKSHVLRKTGNALLAALVGELLAAPVSAHSQRCWRHPVGCWRHPIRAAPTAGTRAPRLIVTGGTRLLPGHRWRHAHGWAQRRLAARAQSSATSGGTRYASQIARQNKGFRHRARVNGSRTGEPLDVARFAL
jgi:hypothetical protein